MTKIDDQIDDQIDDVFLQFEKKFDWKQKKGKVHLPKKVDHHPECNTMLWPSARVVSRKQH